MRGAGAAMSRISIVLATFDRLAPLRDTVASVFAQTFRDFELVVADDGSGEPTRAFLRSLESDPRVRILWREHCGSPALVRNAALSVSTGEFVAFLDSDDTWHPDKLAQQVAALEARPDAQWSYTAFTRVAEDGSVLADERTRRWRPLDGEIFDAILAGEASIRTPCVMARRDALQACGGFDPGIAACEDYDLWLRLSQRSPAVLVDRPLTRVLIGDAGYSAQWPHAVYYQLASVEKLLENASRQHCAALRRQRARFAMQLAREYGARGRGGDMKRTLLRSLLYSWRYPEAWAGALKALLGA
jgi:glycosyltransferase involved in cell wall biosynthesis